MNNNIEGLFKLLVPAIFLILWALNQIFNKEGTPARSRPGTGGPLGPRPGGLPPAPRPLDRSIATGREPSRPSTPPPGGSRARDDEIVIIQSETTRPLTSPRPTNGASGARRATSRTRSGRPPASRPPADSSPVNRSKPPSSASLFEVPPSPATSMGITVPPSTTGRPGENTNLSTPLLIGVDPPITASSIAESLKRRATIREAILINELLNPPLSLRRGPMGRPRGS